MTAVPTHIIVLGASAGGMEELNLFFDNTPSDGVAYVVVQHLSATFKSRMRELLAKHSKLEVREAEDGMQVKNNQVYLIPNDKYLTIKNNCFYLTSKEGVHPPHLTIDKFFKSLAINSGTKAIGIILSGLGKDGTEGIKAIKDAGGMTIARNPENTEFESMPSSAIATGLIDFILEPEFMPGTIEDYIKYGHELLFDAPAEDKNMAVILNHISAQLPFDFTDYKTTTILRRIKRRLAINHFTRLENYIDFLKKNPPEVEALVKEFLISVTSFFRDPEAYKFLERETIPAIMEGLMPGEEIKIWIAGCATGEEAYSLAILFHEKLSNEYADTIVKIFATDIDTVALLQAGKGLYNESVEKAISAERLQKYFTREGLNYKIKPEIRKMVIFAPHDLVKNPPYCNMHLISCRNVLIYMNNVLQKKVFSMLLFGLKLNGYLFLGSSENPQPIIHHLEVMNKKWKIYRNFETKRVIHFEGFSLPQMVDIKENNFLAPRPDAAEKANNQVTEAIAAALAENMDFLVIVIDPNNLVIKTYGNTAKYLLQKNFNLHLPELLPRALSVAFNIATIKSRKEKQKIFMDDIDIVSNDMPFKVKLSVSPLKIKNIEDPLHMLVLCEDRSPSNETKVASGLDEKIYLDQYTLMIEEELNDLKDKLHGTYNQLDASNDNMQSYVEELLSANEEMQSTNEEMQSVNEELHTINTDYQLKNKEL
ncbi:MAG: chemotaxis protein CheR, partial [Rhizobacter sp.]|nr:chemotaxis protein CheR [Ferruginibacter sp.]